MSYSEEEIKTAEKYIIDHNIHSVEIGFADIIGALLGKVSGEFLKERI